MTTLAAHPGLRRAGAGAGVGLALAVAAGVGVLAARSPVLGLGAAFAVLIGATVVRLPDVATLAVLALVYSNAAVNAVKLHGVPYVVGISVPLLLILPLAYHLFVRRRPLVVAPALPLLAVLLVVQIASTFASSSPAASVSALTTFAVEGVGLYLLVTNVVRTLALLRAVVWTLVSLGALFGALSLYQQLTGAFDADFGGFAQVSQAAFVGEEVRGQEVLQKRLAGPIGEQNRYAQIMLVLVPLALLCLRRERVLPLRLAAAAAAALIVAGVALTFSRGAAVGFAALLVAMTALRTLRVHQLALVVAGIALLLATVPAYQTRLATLGALVHVGERTETGPKADSSANNRFAEAAAAALVVYDNPLLGVGPGQFKQHFPEYAARAGLTGVHSNRQAHNLYLGVAADLGLPGLAALLGIFAVTLRGLARVRRRCAESAPELAETATAFMLALVAYATTGLFLHLAFERYLWLLLALAGVVCVLGRETSAGLSSRSGSRLAAMVAAERRK